MSTTIHERCIQSVERLGFPPAPATLKGIGVFATALDAQCLQLSLLARIELENAADEYVVAWITAEHLEFAVRDTGALTTAPTKDLMQPTCRTNPALNQAASARTRMRQIFKTINALLKNALKNPIAGGEAEAPAEPARPTRSTPDRATNAAPTPISTPPDPSTASTPPAPPTAPPMNRAQRRAQARLDSKIQRKQEKRMRQNASRPSSDLELGLAPPDRAAYA